MPRRPHGEHRLDDLLSDPIAALLMRRDGVDADAVRKLLRSKRPDNSAAPGRRRARAQQRGALQSLIAAAS
jgi:transposase